LFYFDAGWPFPIFIALPKVSLKRPKLPSPP
jgi:hypothetical protein